VIRYKQLKKNWHSFLFLCRYINSQ